MQRSTAYRPPLPRRPQLAGNPDAAPGRCPCVGALADPGTALAFPSDSNHCFRTNFPIPISSIHQENYCLSAQYVMCPVFQQYAAQPEKASAVLPLAAPAQAVAEAPQPVGADDELLAAAAFGGAGLALGVGAARSAPAPAMPLAPAPAQGRDFAPYDPSQESALAPERSLHVDKRILLLGLALLALLALAGGARLKLFGGRAGVEDGQQGAVVTMPTLAPTADLSALVADLTAQATPTVAIPATVVEPAGDSAATAPAAAATATTELDSIAATATAMFAGAVAPVECAPVGWWVPYVVVEGDTVESLAASRGITPEELVVGNCLGPQPLVASQSLFLPPVGVIIALLGQPTATLIPPAQPTATRAAGLPTRRPVLFPTPTPIVIIVATAHGITPEAPATDEPHPWPSRAPSTPVPTKPATVVPPPATPTPRSTATPAVPPTPRSTATPVLPPPPTATPAVPTPAAP